MRMLILVVISLIVSGCSMSPESAKIYQEKNNFDSMKVKTAAGEYLSVNDLRADYKNNTGLTLPYQNTTSCLKSLSCFYNRYADSYDSLMSDFRGRQQAKQYELEQIEKQKCNADKECSRLKKLDDLNDRLRLSYYNLVNSNQYMRSDFDMAFRTLCENSSNEERLGETLIDVVNRIKDKLGIDPETRRQAVNAASICWEISKYGGNWKEALR